jgi:hypothetical protein
MRMRPDSGSRAIDDMKPLGDRRARIRLEVVGQLWGTLEVTNEARVVNISRNGALIASPLPAALDSTQALRLTLRGHEIGLRARVRHLKRVARDADHEGYYRIGLEFLDQPAALLQALE